MLRDTHAHARVGTVGDHRFDILGVEGDFTVEHRILTASEGLPVGHRLLPCLPLRRMLTPLQVGEGHLVRSDESAARTHLDGEVAEGETALHGHVADSRPGIFHEVTRGAGCAHLAHDVERHILRGHTLAEFPFDIDSHGFRLRLQHTLARQHHLHLGGSDAESHGTHRAMRGGVRVAADDCHARQGESPLRSDDVDDTIPFVIHAEVAQSEVLCVLFERGHLFPAHLVLDRFVLVVGRDVMVGHAIDLFRAEAF